MAYSELLLRPFLGHQAWSWTKKIGKDWQWKLLTDYRPGAARRYALCRWHFDTKIAADLRPSDADGSAIRTSLAARNWITVIIERSDHSLVAYWGLNFCWCLFTTFWYVISKNVKSHVFWNLKKNEKFVFSNTGMLRYSRPAYTVRLLWPRYGSQVLW